MLTIDLQNYFMPSPEGYPGRIGNQGLLRVSIPINNFGIHQYVRTILSITTTPSVQGGPNTGAGDLTVYDLASTFERPWDHARSWAAYLGTNGQRTGLRFWQMAGRRCRDCALAVALGTIGRTRQLSALLLGEQFEPGWPANDCATAHSLQLPSWLLPPIYGSLDVR